VTPVGFEPVISATTQLHALDRTAPVCSAQLG